MKDIKIKKLDVTVTYRVGISGFDVSDSVYRGLKKMGELFNNNLLDDDVANADEWLYNNIRQSDEYQLCYRVNEID